MLKLSDLALKGDLHFGRLLISPSRRLIQGPGGSVSVEPLVMQALLLLIDADGKVVARAELFAGCWGDAAVGDDSLNRTILKLRRAGRKAAPGMFEVETVPRTGYRLTGPILDRTEPDPLATTEQSPASVSRRTVILGGAATAAAFGGGIWWIAGDRKSSHVDDLLGRGQQALRLDKPEARTYFQQAVEIDPNNARGWGLLAYAIGSAVGDGPRDMDGATAAAVERTAGTALKIDPREPHALLAQTFLRSDMDWISRDAAYRGILEIDPANTLMMQYSGQLLNAVGRCREALAMAEAALSRDPVWPDQQLRKSLRLWVLGRTAEADRTIDRMIELWPSHRLARLARLMIYAFTDRTRAAAAIVKEEEAKPLLLTAEAASVWHASLDALESRTPSAIAKARDVSLEGSKAVPAIASTTILVLSELGELDAAFEVAEGFLLGRGSLIVRSGSDQKGPRVHTPGWRNTYGLFTPPTKAMRLDPRFKSLASGLGLTEYWQKRGINPDGFLFAP